MHAPVALFVYRRPRHARETLESLSRNSLAAESELFVFSDGSRGIDEQERRDVEEVRRLLRTRQWCGKVSVIESTENRGLATSITSGVSEIIRRFGRVIVLEDDLVTSPFFLSYMNRALQVYEHEPKVMHIAGYSPPLAANLPPTYLYRNTTCWGWATWDRAWRIFRSDARSMFAELEKRNLFYRFNLDGSYAATRQLIDNIDGTLDTWAIRWYASVFLAGGLCLHPHRSLVQNIGADGSGTNSGTTEIYRVGELAEQIDVVAVHPVEETREASDAIRRFNLNAHPSLMWRALSRARALGWAYCPSFMVRMQRRAVPASTY